MRNLSIGSDGRCIVLETVLAGVPDFVIAIYPNVAQEAVSGAGAVSIGTYLSLMTSTSTDAWTLADGSVHGQMKKVQFVVKSGNSTLTLASAASASFDVITFSVVGDWCLLMWVDQDDDGAGYWRILETNSEDGVGATPTVA